MQTDIAKYWGGNDGVTRCRRATHQSILDVMATSSSNARSVQRYRARMRRAGLRLVQLWIPDTRARGFAEECLRQSRRAKKHRRTEAQVIAWLDQTRDTEGWTG